MERDGGVNRLFESLSKSEPINYLPDAIIGDLDSGKEEIINYYRYLFILV